MPNDHVQAAAEGLSKNDTDMTRRKALGLLAAVSVAPTAVVGVVAAQPTEQAFDLQTWLNSADRDSVINYHAARLCEAMNKFDSERGYRTQVNYAEGFVVVVGDARRGKSIGHVSFARREA